MTKIPQLKLSVLDQSPIRSGGSAVESINESIELAKACEEAGYNRYWLAEHHGTPSLAGPAPEIMITRIAAETKKIRVGMIGYGFMFGASESGFIGFDGFFFDPTGEDTSGPAMTFFIFQSMFCATAASIISGSVAERLKFNSSVLDL